MTYVTRIPKACVAGKCACCGRRFMGGEAALTVDSAAYCNNRGDCQEAARERSRTSSFVPLLVSQAQAGVGA